MMEQECSSIIKKVLIFSLSNSILLWSYDTRGFMDDTFLLKKRGQALVKLVSSIINFNIFNCGAKLIFDLSIEDGKNITHIILMFEKTNPQYPCTIINEHTNHLYPEMLGTVKGPQMSLCIK